MSRGSYTARHTVSANMACHAPLTSAADNKPPCLIVPAAPPGPSAFTAAPTEPSHQGELDPRFRIAPDGFIVPREGAFQWGDCAKGSAMTLRLNAALERPLVPHVLRCTSQRTPQGENSSQIVGFFTADPRINSHMVLMDHAECDSPMVTMKCADALHPEKTAGGMLYEEYFKKFLTCT